MVRIRLRASPILGNIRESEVNEILLVTQNEIQYLESKGFKWHIDLHNTVGCAGKYYVTQSKSLMKELEKYRSEHIIQV